MNRTIASTILCIALAACGGKAKTPAAGGPTPEPGRMAAPCTADDVIGSWHTESGSGFEEITLEEGHDYATYLNAHPFESGEWSLEGGALVLTEADETVERIEDVRCATNLTGTYDGKPLEWSPIRPGAQ